MVCRSFVTSCNAPEAVWASETPSLALREAWLIPLICEVMLWVMAYPAASSAAVLIRKPEDNCCRAELSVLPDEVRLFCATSELRFVLRTSDMIQGSPEVCGQSPDLSPCWVDRTIGLRPSYLSALQVRF